MFKLTHCFVLIFLYISIISLPLPTVVVPVLPIATVQTAVIFMDKVIKNFPQQDSAAQQLYEKNQSAVVTKCAYVLYEHARIQLLDALREIDNRMAYWHYQKDHQWQYFFAKNPVKWVTGQSQNDEINNNIEQLETHQGLLFVYVGKLVQLGNVFDLENKTTFVTDYTRSYEWIDQLLAVLVGIKIEEKEQSENIPFMVRCTQLRSKLKAVGNVKQDLLSDIVTTQIPHHLERHWLKYGTLIVGSGYGYNTITAKQVKDYLYNAKANIDFFIVDPVQTLVTDVLGVNMTKPSEDKKDVDMTKSTEDQKRVSQDNAQVALDAMKNFILNLKVKENSWFNTGVITQEEKERVLKELEQKKTIAFQEFNNKLIHEKKLFKATEATNLLGQFMLLSAGNEIYKQYAGLGKLAFLTPSALTAALVYSGYQKVTEKDYSLIRRALVDILSLFVKEKQPLSDEAYGKMVYLLDALKKQAQRDLSYNYKLQEDFLRDVEKIELQEFDVAAKRVIVEDMFKKYSFLGLVRQK